MIQSAYNYSHLKHFINDIRHWRNLSDEKFNALLSLHWLNKTSNVKSELNTFIKEIFEQAFFVNAFTEYGINSNTGFFSEIISRIKHKILPEVTDNNELSNYINFLLEAADDYLWINKISQENWLNIFSELDFENNSKIKLQFGNSLTILSNRLTTLGIDRNLSSKYPSIDDFDSPFFNLSIPLNEVINTLIADNQTPFEEVTKNQLFRNIATIEKLFHDIQIDIKESGTSLELVFLLKRAQQHVARIKLLLNLILAHQQNDVVSFTTSLIKELIVAEKQKNSISQFFKAHTQLLAYRIVSHTSKKGEGYIGFSKNENKELLISAMGGGLVVVLLVYLKHLIHQLHLSLFFEGIVFGLNYGIGFVAMHLLHFTLATKQPALTAAYIAESIENVQTKANESRQLFLQIIKSQLISLIGNLIIVVPCCFFSALLFLNLYDITIFNEKETESAFYNNHLFYSLALLYACFTGIFLSLSGLVTGYIDNKVVYSKIAFRIEKHPKLKLVYNDEKRKRIARFFEINLGAIIGNLFLGICLGMAGNIGEFIGIPFDIRHVTISAGNFSIALTNMHLQDLALILTSFTTIILIGLLNIVVSFMISFIIACRSRGLSWRQSVKVLLNKSIIDA